MTNALFFITSVIGSATLIFRGLLIITKTNKDNDFVKYLIKLFEMLSLNVSELKNEIIIKVKKK